MKEFFIKHNKAIFVAVSTIFFMVVGYIIMFTNLGAIAPQKGIEVMDGKWFYPPSYIKETLSNLGAEGRAQYTVFHIIDYFFLVSYCMVMMSITRLVTSAKWVWVVFPLLPSSLDLIENTLIEIAISSYPNISANLSKAISVFTTLKWSTGILWFAVFIALLSLNIIRLIKKFKQQKQNQ
ncbi:MAG: hypothetical protein GX242_02660 [Clostridiales bacterium]|jgi:hypothetical protein|nr:hypothetical protein [Clostridiales bacterium]